MAVPTEALRVGWHPIQDYFRTINTERTRDIYSVSKKLFYYLLRHLPEKKSINCLLISGIKIASCSCAYNLNVLYSSPEAFIS